MNTVTLYGLNKAGGFKVWNIHTEGDKIHITHGKEGGKLQLKIDTVKGKNIGKANETTPELQAEFEATSRINKQRDKGYRENKTELEGLPLLPMLAADYLKQGHRISYPCYASPKLDGVRCLAIRTECGVTLRSRGGKDYTVDHIQTELFGLMMVGDVWDGELYIHGKFLEEIVSAVKKPNEDTCNLKFVIFDIVNDDDFSSRLCDLRMICLPSETNVQLLDYTQVFSEEQMKSLHKQFVSWAYEGIMLRNAKGLYESGKRSADLQKYKEFLDMEFKIVAVGEDKNGNAVLCVFDELAVATFNVCYGDFEERKRQIEHWKEYIGKWLTVKFQTRYKDSLLPQFPTGVMLRECDTYGNPVE